jgi:hypothetical protein
MKNKYINFVKTIFLVGLLGLWLPSCNDYLDINDDPNNPISLGGDYDLLIADITNTMSYNIVGGGNFTRYSAQWMQQIADVSAPPSNDTYRFNTSDFNNEWAFYSYSTILIGCKDVIENGTVDGAMNHVAIAKIMMALNYGVLTDFFGAIPFSEALQRTGNLKPAYDSQEAVYDGIQTLLDEAIAAIDLDSPVEVGSGDFLLGGDMAKWRKVANMLKARYALHLVNAPGKDPNMQAQAALNALSEAMDSPADEPRFVYMGGAGEEGPWNQWIEKFANTMKVSQNLLDMLTALNDPRLPMMVDTSENTGTYVGHKNGNSNLPDELDDVSDIGIFYYQPETYIPVVTYVEQKFIEAEANLILGNMPEAEAAYAAAIKSHMSMLSGEGETGETISETEMDDYITANPLNDLEDLITQKYLGLYLWGAAEVYNDFRRTGFPQLTPAMNALFNQIPTRIPYPDTEINNNKENVPGGVTPTSKVWWDAD